jgi:hypothetical protein
VIRRVKGGRAEKGEKRGEKVAERGGVEAQGSLKFGRPRAERARGSKERGGHPPPSSPRRRLPASWPVRGHPIINHRRSK